MFWDQEPSSTQEKSKKPLEYTVLETEFERIYKKTWYKLEPSHYLWRMIIDDVAGQGTHWYINKEITGKSFIWVTDKYLTLLCVKGACRVNQTPQF